MPDSLSVGKIIGERYEIVRKLATGGFGQTYVAQDNQRPGKPKCVVKLLRPASNDLNFLENARRLFNTEAETLERLGNHRQVPRLLAYFEEDKDFYLVQEYVEGSLLSEELSQGNRWSVEAIVRLMKEALQILCFLHSHNVIHRDIKPDNIIRRPDGTLVLVDFGTVKQIRNRVAVMGAATATISVGTPGYMPTEQSHGKPRPSSDIYALGVIVIQAMTGLAPNQLEDDEETGEFIWRQQAADFDAELVGIVYKMVRYHFRDRYRSATAASEALNIYIASHPELLKQIALTTPLLDEGAVAVQAAQAKAAQAKEDQTKEDQTKEDQTALSPQLIAKKATTKPAIIKPPTELHLTPAEAKVKVSPSRRDKETVLGQKNALEKDSLEKDSSDVFSQKRPTYRVASAVLPASLSAISSTVNASDLEAILRGFVTPLSKYNFWSRLSRQNKWKVALTSFTALSLFVGGRWLLQEKRVLSEADNLLLQGQRLYAGRDYEACIDSAQEVSSQRADIPVAVYERSQDLEGDCLFAKAKAEATALRFEQGIAIAQEISPGMKNYDTAQLYVSKWSQDIFETAVDDYNYGQYEKAKSAIRAIPEEASMARAVQNKLKDWEKEQKQNEERFANVKKAFVASDWEKVIEEANKITLSRSPLPEDHPYLRQDTKTIVQQAEEELTAATEREQQWETEAAVIHDSLISYDSPKAALPLDMASKAYKPLPPTAKSTYVPPVTYRPSAPNYSAPAELAPSSSVPSGTFNRSGWQSEQR